ncbi:hypothetical protein CAEBREN_18511 [Caenorhabditis brenneri]|uniref:Uncharacterized protein n=1 Tax=Caenorhabditis brenneri TaxID=135651 RepID=G0N025_CAEBE|nr:hypothetical protein CAEBREN_18511 [Caenorhabditis brenneri]
MNEYNWRTTKRENSCAHPTPNDGNTPEMCAQGRSGCEPVEEERGSSIFGERPTEISAQATTLFIKVIEEKLYSTPEDIQEKRIREYRNPRILAI